MKRISHIFVRLKAFLFVITNPSGYAKSIGVRMGKGIRLYNLSLSTFGSEPYLIQLGDRVTVGPEVRFITHDGAVGFWRQEHLNVKYFGHIEVEDNAFTGSKAMILPGMRIGKNRIIWAGSVVARDIPDYCFAAGVPARFLKTMEEYWKSIKDRVNYIRDLPEMEKQKFLEEKFYPDK